MQYKVDGNINKPVRIIGDAFIYTTLRKPNVNSGRILQKKSKQILVIKGTTKTLPEPTTTKINVS